MRRPRLLCLLLAGCLLLISSKAKSQNQQSIDSLIQILDKRSGLDRVEILSHLHDATRRSAPETGLSFAKEIKNIGEQFNEVDVQLNGLYRSGASHVVLRNYDTLAQIGKIGTALATQVADDSLLSKFLNYRGIVFEKQSSLDSAIHYYKLAIAAFPNDALGTYNNIGLAYSRKGDIYNSIQYLEKAYTAAKATNNINAQAVITNNIGGNYGKLHLNEKAEEYALLSIDLKDQIGDERGKLFAYHTLSQYSTASRDAMADIEKAIQIAETVKDSFLLHIFLMNKAYEMSNRGNDKEALELLLPLGEDGSFAYDYLDNSYYRRLALIYLNLNEADKAEQAAIKALELGLEINDHTDISLTKDILSRVYAKQGRYKEAYENAVSHASLKDSINFQSNTDRMAFMESQLEDVEKQMKIDALNRDIERSKFQRLWMSVLVTLVGVILLIILYFRNRQVKVQQQIAQKEKETAKELARLNEELKALDEAKNTFFANVSHELRTPLTLIAGPIRQMLRKGQLPKDDLALAELIDNNTAVLQRRVNEILDLTKLESNKLQLEEAATELVAEGRKLTALFESNAQQKEIELEFIAHKSPIHALVDAGKVTTIIQNFISNALKFTPPKGRIQVQLSKQKESILWKVQDNGRGIPKAETERIFDRYYQASTRKGVAEGGTGIGLALAKDLAELMNGKVWAESEINNGSTFYLQIPYQAADAPAESISGEVIAATVPSLIAKSTANEGARILLVEDNQDLQKYIGTLLADYQIQIASNGQEALDFLKENEVELIISDVMMPVMDGFELLEHLKNDAQLQKIPIIMLTARAAIEDKLHALRIGVDDYIIKPFVEEELMARVGNLIERLQAREPLEAEESVPAEATLPASQQVWLTKVETTILDHLSNRAFNLDQLADRLLISKRQLQRRIKSYTGMTASEYVREVRLHKARTLLESGHLGTVSEIAYAVGFEHQHYFSQVFRQRYGKKPTEYLR